MRRSGRFMRVALFSAGLALLAGSAPRALAQTAPRDEREYRTTISKALEEFQTGNYLEARALFLRAHTLNPNAATLRALGLVEFELRHYVEALRLLESALAEPRNRLAGAKRAEVEQAIVRVRAFVGRYRLAVDPPSAELSLDGNIIANPGDAPLLLAVGEHVLVVREQGYRSTTHSLDVKGGENWQLSIALERLTRAEAATRGTEGAKATLDTASTTASRDDGGPGALPWVLLIGSGAAAVAGGVLLALSASDIDSVESAAQDSAYRDVRGEDERAPVLSGVGFGLLGLGVVGAVASVVWLGSDDTDEASAQLRVGPSAVQLRARF